MDLDTITKAAVANPIAAASMFDKNEIYSAVCGIAASIRKPGESVFKARQRASATPEGMALMAAYSAAPKAKTVQKVARASVEDLRKSMPGGDVIAQIDQAARKIAAEERMPMTRARAEAWKRNPELKRAYDSRANLRSISNGRC
jgi:hypothetical protein